MLLAAGELADLPIGEVAEADFLQAGGGPVALRAPRTAEPPQLAVRSHQDHVHHADGEVPIDAFALRHVADAASDLIDRFAEDPDGAADDGEEAEDRLDERALAGAVGPDHGDQARAFQSPVHVPEHRLAVIGDRGHGRPGGVRQRLHRSGCLLCWPDAQRDILACASNNGVTTRASEGFPSLARRANNHLSAFTMVSTLWRTMPT